MIFLFSLFGYIAWCDITKRKIYNITIGALLFLSLFLIFLNSVKWTASSFFYGFSSFFIFFFCFLIFYVVNWMGAADVKLAGVLAFLFGAKNFFSIVLISIALTLLYVLVVKILSILKMQEMRKKLTFNDVGRKFIPYGGILCVASMIFIIKQEMGS